MSNPTATYAINTSNLYLTVNVDGTGYPLMAKRGVQFWANENKNQSMPSFHLVLDDVAGQLGNNVPINDGSTIIVLCGTSPSQCLAYTFKSFGKPARIPSKETPGANTYHIQGICTIAAMATARPSEPIHGTSKDVFQKAADTFKLNLVSNFNPDDLMAWLPSNMPWSHFLSHTSEHAYSNENSVTAHTIDSQNNLHFHNLPDIMKGDVKAYIYRGAVVSDITPRFPCAYYKHISRAGEENHKAVYGAETYQPQADGTTASHDKATTSLLTSVIDAGKDIKDIVENVPKMLFAPVDCGNNHDNYIKARHQNFRLRSVYNQNVYVGLMQFSNLRLFDVVYFSSTDVSGNVESDVTGKYFVSAITRFVASGRYYEKIELTSSGLYSGDNELV